MALNLSLYIIQFAEGEKMIPGEIFPAKGDAYLKQAYREKGYHLIEVPMLSVEERVAFIKAHL